MRWLPDGEQRVFYADLVVRHGVPAYGARNLLNRMNDALKACADCDLHDFFLTWGAVEAARTDVVNSVFKRWENAQVEYSEWKERWQNASQDRDDLAKPTLFPPLNEPPDEVSAMDLHQALDAKINRMVPLVVGNLEKCGCSSTPKSSSPADRQLGLSETQQRHIERLSALVYPDGAPPHPHDRVDLFAATLAARLKNSGECNLTEFVKTLQWGTGPDQLVEASGRKQIDADDFGQITVLRPPGEHDAEARQVIRDIAYGLIDEVDHMSLRNLRNCGCR